MGNQIIMKSLTRTKIKATAVSDEQNGLAVSLSPIFQLSQYPEIPVVFPLDIKRIEKIRHGNN
jgi:hypothetical protein